MNSIIVFVLAFVLHLASTANDSAFIAEGPSMEPLIHAKDKISASSSYYKDQPIQRGDISIFNATKDRMYIKRVVALPGENVKVEGDNVYINGELLGEPYLDSVVEAAKNKGVPWNMINFAEHKVPDGCYFVLGDNRSNSADSRTIGFIKTENIIGNVTAVNGIPIQ